METVTVSYDQCGNILPLHGVNCAPYNKMSGANQAKVNELFTLANIPFSRLHDVEGSYGGCYFVDIPNIFRNWDADVNDPDSYDFYYTDEYITAIIQSGAQIVYRLGITIEWGSKKYRTVPPADPEKWACICEHIVAHYNEGWANGFHYEIPMWEIWNEPENPPMWSGTMEQFFELYRVTGIKLKQHWPQLMIGGYGSCGFYAINQEKDDFYKSFLTWFDSFLSFCKENNCPLDFFSWHIYTGDPAELINHAKYVREKLDAAGFTATEAHLNEWNYGMESFGFMEKHTDVGASFLADSLCRMQHTRYVDKAMYYVFSSNAMYDGFLDQNTKEIDVPYWVYVAFGDLYRKGTMLKDTATGNLQALAAADDREAGLLIANYDTQPVQVTLALPQGAKPVICPMGKTMLTEGTPLEGNILSLPAHGTVYLRWSR